MKTRSIFMILFAFVAMSCAKEVLPEANPEENTELNLVPMEFTTSLETKAGIVDGQSTVEWKAGDAITVFDELGGRNKFTTSTGGKTSTFTGTVTEGAAEFYALYPERTSSAEFDPETKIINSKLFPDQTAVLGSYAKGNGGAVMVAKADENNRLSFKNMTSHIRFTLNVDDVVSITLMGNNAESVAGVYTIDYSDNEPAITITKPETYVRLHNGGEVLAQGDYFFTLLPVEFTKGFTVILSKKDGTQVARKTENTITSVNQRNQILPMKEVSKYYSHMNYFVKYLDGFDITLGGYTFNNETHSGAKLVNGTYNNGTITTDGVYFIDSSYESAILDKNAFSSLVVVGVDEAQRARFTLGRPVQPKNDGTVVLLANLDCKVRKNDDTAINAFNQPNSGGFSRFGKVVGYNSHFRNVASNFIEFKKTSVETLDVHLEDCEFGLAAETVYIVNTGDLETTIQNVKMINNIFYVETGTTMTSLRLVNGDKLSVNNFNADDNTFDSTTQDGRLIRIGDFVTTMSIYQNLFVNCTPTLESKLADVRVGTNKATVAGTVSRNHFFTASEFILVKGMGSAFANSTINNPARLTNNPLSSSWSPASGTFGPYTFEEGVSAQVGAWRDDMKASSTTANYAATNYVSVDYGAL